MCKIATGTIRIKKKKYLIHKSKFVSYEGLVNLSKTMGNKHILIEGLNILAKYKDIVESTNLKKEFVDFVLKNSNLMEVEVEIYEVIPNGKI